MGELADQLDAMVVEATCPDGQIRVRVHGPGARIELEFRPGAYRRYRSEAALADQLGYLAELTFARYRAAERHIVAAALATPLLDDGPDFGPERRRYLSALAQLSAEGTGGAGGVRVGTRGLRTWRFTIAAGVVRAWSEQQFRTAVQQAVTGALAHYNRQVFALKDRIYDLGYPPRIRRAAGLADRTHDRAGLP